MKHRKSLVVVGAACALAFTLTTAAFAQTISVGASAAWNNAGITLAINKAKSVAVAGTNATLISFNTGTLDTAITPAPLISNGWWMVVNNATTNSQNYIKCGNSNNTYSVFILPQEGMTFRLFPGGDGSLHCACSNGTASGSALALPNP